MFVFCVVLGFCLCNNIGVFPFQLLPAIIFVYALASMLSYLGFVNFVLRTFAKFVSVAVDTSPTESLAIAANAFFDQVKLYTVLHLELNWYGQIKLMSIDDEDDDGDDDDLMV